MHRFAMVAKSHRLMNSSALAAHGRAAALLHCILRDSLRFMRERRAVGEYEASRFIEARIATLGLVCERDSPIVAFGPNTAFVHYFPSQYCRRLRSGMPVLIDIWARLRAPGAPYADVTWMAWSGRRVKPDFSRAFRSVCAARDAVLRFVRAEVRAGRFPRGDQADEVARRVIAGAGYPAEAFPHTTGHALGFRSPHGPGIGLGPRHNKRLRPLVGYTIEPGIYLKGRFGVRSEIDFYFTPDRRVAVTTKIQKELSII